LSQKRYDVVYADPPWFYNARNNKNSKFGGGAGGHYPLMKTGDICALPVSELAEDDAVLFLWATFPRLTDALEVIEAWGFTYKTVGFTWGKLTKDGKPALLPGFYTGSNAEVCLLATRGKVLHPTDKAVRSLVLTQGRMRHSSKPEAVRDGIERLYPWSEKVELFAREEADGWDHWGNELPATADLEFPASSRPPIKIPKTHPRPGRRLSLAERIVNPE
jgi:N6-adenosine-specific RNA methylase IME4